MGFGWCQKGDADWRVLSPRCGNRTVIGGSPLALCPMCLPAEGHEEITPHTHFRGLPVLKYFSSPTKWDAWDWYPQRQQESKTTREISSLCAIVLLEIDISQPREFMTDKNQSVQGCKDGKDPLHQSIYTRLRRKLFPGSRQDHCS